MNADIMKTIQTLEAPDTKEDAVIMRTITVQGEQTKLDARLYTPVATSIGGNPPKQGLIVFFPPGGFVTADLDLIEPFIRMLAARTGYLILSSTYTVASERPFPAAVEDAHAILAWVLKQKKKLGWDGQQLITAGLEAGANLAAVSALMARDRGGPALAAQMLMMPMLDPGLTSCSMRTVDEENGAAHVAVECAAGYRDYLPRAIDRTHPYASPLQSSRMKGLPPTLVLAADDDPLRDEAEQYAAKLSAAGITTIAKRLPAIPLAEKDGRCSCMRKEDALQQIVAFIEGINSQ